MASSGNIEQFQSPRRTFCGVDMKWDVSSYMVACENDVILKSESGLLDSGRLKSVHFEVHEIHSLLGRKFSDPKLQYELHHSLFLVTEDLDGFPLVRIENGSSAIVGNPVQILTQKLIELKDQNVSDCCIGIPVHFTYQQRKELLAAASMARLVLKKLLHQTTAAALAYRFSETDLPPSGELFNIVFVDVSHTSMQVSVVELKRDQLKVLSHAHDESIGTRAFYQVIIDHVSAKFKLDANQMTFGSLCRLHHADVHNSITNLFLSCVESVHKLCAKTEAELTYDTEKIVLKREEFEELSSGLLVKVGEVLQKALNEAGLAAVDVHSVQALGYSLKMPAIVNIIKNILKKEPKTFRDARPITTGCIIECAKYCLSSRFPKFQVIDILPYSIGLSWRSENESTVEQLVLFRKGSPFPNVQTVTLQRAGVFSLDLILIDADDSQGSSKISTYSMLGRNTSQEVEVKVQLDDYGLAYLASATVNGSRGELIIIEHPCDERQTTVRDKIEKAEKELADVSMQLKNISSEETNRRINVEKRLEEEASERRRLHHQFEELRGLLETTTNQKEQLQIERDNAVKDNKLSRIKVANFTEFSLAELEEVTNNFDNSCKIGEGGFGSVYKGFLRFTNVAIKMLKSESSQGDIEFNQEIEILTKVRHPNLVSLIGANPESRALIFEFVPNGSLDTFLTKGENSNGVLSWQDRIRIASELCSAIIFLHCVPPHGIVHGDLKPQNILLDSNLVTKLADFGISRKMYQTSGRSTLFHATNFPKCTPAYCAPEFFSSFELTRQCDVYSFGIILLQLVTGRDAQAIKYYVEEALKASNFDKEVDETAGNWPIEEAEKVASLGLWCSHPLASKRPDLAKDVWPSIESMKDVAGLN